MRSTNITSRKGKPLSVKEAFRKLYIALETKTDTLTKQLTKAESQFPELMLAYKMTTSYARYMEKTVSFLSRGRISYTPHPDDESGGGIIFPPIIEGIDLVQELEEYTKGLLSFGADIEAEFAHEVRACPIIRQDYNNAKRCVERFLENPPETEEEWEEYFDCLDRLELHASEMHSHNCSF